MTIMKTPACLLLVGATSFLISCSKPKPPSPEFLALKERVELNNKRITKNVQIFSEPAGARIEVNQEYIGVTPCNVEVVTNGHGELVGDFNVTALPTQHGHYVQLKWFKSYDKAPTRLFFDMRLGRPRPAIDVNILD